MANDSQRDKARATFGKTFFENSKALPNPKNAAAALQKRANARPIPTYKVGGAVKKQTPPQPTAAEREADRKRREEYAKMKVTKEQGEAITRGNRAAAMERPGYKKGGKIQTSADTARKLATEMGGMKKGGKTKKDGLAVMIAIGEAKKPVKKAVGGRMEGRGKMNARGMMKRPIPMEREMPVREMPVREPMEIEVVGYPQGTRGKTPTPTPPPPPPPPSRGSDIPVIPNPPPLPPGYAKGGAMKKPAKYAAGGAGKVRKGMMKGK